MNRDFNRHSYNEDVKRAKIRHGAWMWPVWMFLLFCLFLPPKIQTVGVYRLKCPDVMATGETCPKPLIPERTQYRVFINDQYVVSKNLLKAYKDCDVYDKRNWECRTPQMIITMRNGKELFSTRPEGYTSQAIQLEAGKNLLDEEKRNPQVSPWRWYFELVKYWVNDLTGKNE
jgi:hypothetical protein